MDEYASPRDSDAVRDFYAKAELGIAVEVQQLTFIKHYNEDGRVVQLEVEAWHPLIRISAYFLEMVHRGKPTHPLLTHWVDEQGLLHIDASNGSCVYEYVGEDAPYAHTTLWRAISG